MTPQEKAEELAEHMANEKYGNKFDIDYDPYKEGVEEGYLSRSKEVEELVSVLQSSLLVFEEAIKQSNNPNKPEDFKFYAKGMELLNKYK